MMSFKCKICGDSFESLRSIHAHIKKHGKLLGDYYVENYARKDKLTGELIPFKKYDQYFAADFINKRNMKKWCETAPPEEVKDFIANGWMLIAMIIAVRPALDYKSTLRSVAVCVLGLLVKIIALTFILIALSFLSIVVGNAI